MVARNSGVRARSAERSRAMGIEGFGYALHRVREVSRVHVLMRKVIESSRTGN